MTYQALAVAVIVPACGLSALWTLLPAAARRALASAALKQRLLPLPGFVSARLNRVAQAGAGCACDGCDRAAPVPAQSSGVPIHFRPRR